MSYRSEILTEETPENQAKLFRHWSRVWFEEYPPWIRASHLSVCKNCGRLCIQHPMYSDGVLNKLCNGDLVKL